MMFSKGFLNIVLVPQCALTSILTNIIPGKSKCLLDSFGIIPTLNHFHEKCFHPQIPSELTTAPHSPFSLEEPLPVEYLWLWVYIAFQAHKT